MRTASRKTAGQPFGALLFWYGAGRREDGSIGDSVLSPLPPAVLKVFINVFELAVKSAFGDAQGAGGPAPIALEAPQRPADEVFFGFFESRQRVALTRLERV
jgi:hypothetical protein